MIEGFDRYCVLCLNALRFFVFSWGGGGVFASQY